MVLLLHDDIVGTPDVALIAPSQLPHLTRTRTPHPAVLPSASPSKSSRLRIPTMNSPAKIREYLEAGTRAVRIFASAKCRRFSSTAPPRTPAILTAAADLLEEPRPCLPGFSAPVEECIRSLIRRLPPLFLRSCARPQPSRRSARSTSKPCSASNASVILRSPRRQANSFHRSHTRPHTQLPCPNKST